MFLIRARIAHLLVGTLIRAVFCVATGIALILAIIHNANANIAVEEQSKSVTIAPPGAPSTEQIDAAIDKAVQYLMSQQVDGKWDRPSEAGAAPLWRLTALVLLALTDAGQSPQNADIRKSADILDQAKLQNVQTAAMRAQFDGATAFARPKASITRGADVLAAAGLTGEAPRRKAYTPMVGEGFGSQNPDHVSSYFELLGLDACQENWAKIPADFWKDADLQWRHHQLADGGWPLSASVQHDIPTESDFRSTAAGILALELMAVTPHAIDIDAFDGCKGNAVDPELEKAMVWLGQRTPQMCGDLAAGKLQHPCEMCWWFEKVIQTTGRNRIDSRNFSGEMAHWVVTHQNEDGSWEGGISETAWGLRCLAEFRRAPAFAKLRYAPGIHNSAWNERPSDVRNFTAYVGRDCYCGNLQRWQIFDLAQPLDDLLGMPVLFIAGNNELDFDDLQISKLRKFVERGGLILGNADCGNAAFASSFRQLGKRLCPQYDFRKLPPSHPVFNEMFHARHWKRQVELEGMSNGVRELLLLIPEADIALAWQHDARASRREAFQLATNIHLYSMDRGYMGGEAELRPAEKTAQNWRTVHVARLQIGDNWNPEPRAWQRMLDVMRLNCKIKVEVKPIKSGFGQLAGYEVAHLTGTAAFTFTPGQRDELKAFVEKGGLLLIDAAGGSSEFADAAQNELHLVFGDSARELDSFISVAALDSKQPGFQPIDRIQYRIFARQQFAGNVHASRLRAIRHKGRLAVIFSREDLTAGMGGIHSDGIVGYDIPTASAIVRNILLYAMPPDGE